MTRAGFAAIAAVMVIPATVAAQVTQPQAAMVDASGQSTLVGASALSAAAPDATTAVTAAMGIPIRQLCRTSASRSRRAAGNVASSAGTRTNCIGTTDANTNALKNSA